MSTNPTISDFPALFSELQIGDVKLKNRIAMAPLTRGRAGISRIANDIMKEYYKQRSSAGLIITEGTFVSDEAIGWRGAPGIFTDEQMRAWKDLVSHFRAHNNDTAFFMQLWHCGRSSHSSFHINNRLPVAPSSIALSGQMHTESGKQDFEVPHSLTSEEIKQTVLDYKNAAMNAQKAGFTGIEIHAANGYLIDEFLQSKTNHRIDEYGGSFQNRFRILREIIEAVLDVFPSNRIAVRLSPNGDYNEMGSPDFREAFTYYIQELDRYNLAYLHVLDGLDHGFHGFGEPFTLRDVRKVYNGILIGNCGYDPKLANQAIESGAADLISFGRLFISNPDLAERLANNWPLNDFAPVSAWYSGGAEGYIDFPVFKRSSN